MPSTIQTLQAEVRADTGQYDAAMKRVQVTGQQTAQGQVQGQQQVQKATSDTTSSMAGLVAGVMAVGYIVKENSGIVGAAWDVATEAIGAGVDNWVTNIVEGVDLEFALGPKVKEAADQIWTGFFTNSTIDVTEGMATLTTSAGLMGDVMVKSLIPPALSGFSDMIGTPFTDLATDFNTNSPPVIAGLMGMKTTAELLVTDIKALDFSAIKGDLTSIAASITTVSPALTAIATNPDVVTIKNDFMKLGGYANDIKDDFGKFAGDIGKFKSPAGFSTFMSDCKSLAGHVKDIATAAADIEKAIMKLGGKAIQDAVDKLKALFGA